MSDVIVVCSTFQLELEKCVDQPQKIGGVFIRYVSLSSKLVYDDDDDDSDDDNSDDAYFCTNIEMQAEKYRQKT